MIQTNEAFLKVAVLDPAYILFKNFSEINKFLLSQGNYWPVSTNLDICKI